MVRRVTVGVAQLQVSGSKESNVRKLKELIARKKGVNADIVVAPEYLLGVIEGGKTEMLGRIAESIDSPLVRELERLAVDYGFDMVTSILERQEETRKAYNSVLLIRNTGGVEVVYRKTHLFDAYGFLESKYVAPGSSLSKVMELGGVRVAFSLCFELRFPEVYRTYAIRGAEMVLTPAAWYAGHQKEEALRFLAQARAHENTIFVVIANQTGRKFVGRSMVVDPMGTVILDLGSGEGYNEVEVDIDQVYEVRKALPVLSLRRPELYSL